LRTLQGLMKSLPVTDAASIRSTERRFIPRKPTEGVGRRANPSLCFNFGPIITACSSAGNSITATPISGLKFTSPTPAPQGTGNGPGHLLPLLGERAGVRASVCLIPLTPQGASGTVAGRPNQFPLP